MNTLNRTPQSQQEHDQEVCRLANKYSTSPIWSSCSEVANHIDLPTFPYEGTNYEPDVFLSQVPPSGKQTLIDWIFEIETSESVSSTHTKNQLTAFSEYLKQKSSRVIVIVPPQEIEKMKENLSGWGLTGVMVQPWGWP